MRRPFQDWFLEGHRPVEGFFESEKQRDEAHHPTHRWWEVMCLTGVDYFSTLGYQPGIAFLAAGALSPMATLVLVVLTLAGALPIYANVARESPRGEGSIAMLKSLVSKWNARLMVLVLLGFVATDFIITITLSAADAAMHVRENPLFSHAMESAPLAWQMGITACLILLLGAVFLKGFKEAIGIAVVLVLVYLGLNAVVLGRGLFELARHPEAWAHWGRALEVRGQGNPWILAGLALVYFPKLALGLSGFETGVAVMQLVQGNPGDNPNRPEGRIRNTKRLLVSAAVLMSIFLICSSFVTTLLIPAEAFKPHGPANGRALAFLAYQFFGKAFGTVYDASTIAILWFAGASAMAGLLNIVPHYLPGYGMAPEWTRATRPVVLVFVGIALLVTLLFRANVDAQGGAYATGVLVLMTSAAVAVCISISKRRGKVAAIPYGVIASVFVYTTGVNVVERPDGVKIAACFIAGILTIAVVSRIWRTMELRVARVELDDSALRIVEELSKGDEIRFIANHPDERDAVEYTREEREAAWTHHLDPSIPKAFVEVYVDDSSEFRSVLQVTGHDISGFRVLRCRGVAVPNALAALLIHVGQLTGRRPHIYFHWIETSPWTTLAKFFLTGQGDIAPLTREVLRKAVRTRSERPVVHSAG